MKVRHTTQPGPKARNPVSNLPLYVTAFSLLTAVTLTAAPASVFAAEPMTMSYEGNLYTVNKNNTQVLDVQPVSEVRTEVCTEESPCRYDDLPAGADEFVTSGGSWANGRVTYSFVNTSPDLSLARERGIIGQALGLWSNVARVYPSEVAAGADPCAGNIRISWVSGNHGDGSSFDGPGGVLAHAFFPPPNTGNCLDGDTHFDEDETWRAPSSGGGNIDLCTVAAHEFGHALGLRHSTDNNALMAPFYTGRRCYLSFDDIAGIIAIYGSRFDDVIFQLEMPTTVAPGAGSFRLRENSVTVKLKLKGSATSFHTVVMPTASSDVGISRADVDGVLSRSTFVSQFDGSWFNKGDLVRTQFVLPAGFPDVDRVDVTLNLTNNSLTTNATVTASMNGIKLGDIVISPGVATKSQSFPVVFVNPNSNTRDVGANLYGQAPH